MHLFVDNLTNVDFSYLHPSRGVVGETWLASIVLEGALDDQGMVCDFGVVKKTVRDWLDATIDHSLVVPKGSDSLVKEQSDQHNISIQWQYSGKQLDCHSPAQAITLIDHKEVNEQTVADWCIEQLRQLLPESIGRIQLRFAPEPIEHHFYHYSHGLKKHRGNCQRIAHGHRSTIEIMIDQQRDHQLEANWCQLWEDIYIGTKEDLLKEETIEGIEYYQFAYQSEQGEFTLKLAKEDCYLIDTDTTVELIAQHITTQIAAKHPGKHVKIKAFEGIGKGAIAFEGN